MRALVLSLSGLVIVGCGSEPDPGEPYVYLDQLESSDGLASVRSTHAATLLDDGRVMLVGGIRGSPSQLDFEAFVVEVELFDPIDERFEQGASLESGRSWPTATRVADGRVIVVGGSTLDISAQSIPALAIEVWDPETELFTTVGELPVGGVQFNCAAAVGDAALIIDDCDPGNCAPLWIDPDTGPTALTGDPSYSYQLDVDCVTLSGDRVLLAGGMDVDTPADYAEIYDPETETFELVGPLGSPHSPKVELVVLSNGDVFMFGDTTDPSTLGHVYSVDSGDLTPVTGIADRTGHSLTLLADGRVLITGGILNDSPDLDTALGLEQFDPSTATITTVTGTSFESRIGHTAVRLETGPVLLAGGELSGVIHAESALFR